jgi:hypothetical protein
MKTTVYSHVQEPLVDIPESEFGEWPHACMILKEEALDIGRNILQLITSMPI